MTGHSFQHRWNQHLADVRNHCNDYVFHKALKKYGIEEFKTEIVSTGLTKTEAQQREIELIRECNSYYLGGWGYNMTYGGQRNDHLKGEKAPGAKLTDKQASLVRHLLKDYSLTLSQIAQKIGIEPNKNNCVIIIRINQGITYGDEQEHYPIRIDGRVIEGPRRKGEKNPSAKLTEIEVQQIIDLLINTNLAQCAIAKQFGVTYNTVNFINRCLIWTDLHHFKHNIRKEREVK